MRAVPRANPAEKTFLILALLLGLGYVVINPPFAVNDEDVHMARIFELASGRLVTRMDAEGEYHYVPADYLELGRTYQGIAQAKGVREGRVRARALFEQLVAPREQGALVRMPGRAGGYSPVPYHLQIAVVWLCEKLGLGVLAHLYSARLVSLAAYVILSWQAIRLAATLGWLFAAVALMPMALTQAAGVSGDGMVIGLSLLFFALVARGSVVLGEPLSRRALAGLTLCLVSLTLCKPVYVLAALSLPILRWPRAHRPARANVARFLYPLLSIVLACLAYAWWGSKTGAAEGDPGVDAAARQLKLLLDEPVRIVRIGLATTLRSIDDLLIQSIFVRYRIAQGMRFSGGFVSVLYAYLLVALAVGAAGREQNKHAPLRMRWLASACLSFCALAILAAVPAGIYICCNRFGGSWVTGFHGRYLIPAFPPVLLALSLFGRPVIGRWLRLSRHRLTVVAIVLANIVCYLSLIGWHYYPLEVAWPL
jgi:uncharacterized membrane protein